LSTLALDASKEGAGASAILRYLDLILLAVALPVFVAADWPLLGYAVAAAVWIAQRLVLAYTDARTARSLAAGDRRDAFRTTAISGLGRVWMVSAAALLVGLIADREDGLAAALLLTALFTVQLATTVSTRRSEVKE
jgi:L-asparagine transporter-like permease